MIRILYDFVPCGPKDEPGLKVSYEYIEHAYEQVPDESYRYLDDLLFGRLIPYRARRTSNRKRLIYPRRKRAKKE